MNMHPYHLIFALCLTTSMALCTTAMDGTWSAGSGVWGDAANWAGGTIASGTGATAWFTNTITADVNVFPYAPETIGNISVNDPDGVTNAISIKDGSNAFTLAGVNPIINCGTRLNLQPVVYGTAGFTKLGPGVLNLGVTSNLISGNVNLYQGSEILLNHYQALLNADVNVTGTLVKSQKFELYAKSLTVGLDGKVDIFNIGVGENNAIKVAVMVKDSITVTNGGTLGAGLTDGFTGRPFSLLSPAVTVNSGGSIIVNYNTPLSLAEPGISGSNITVNSDGQIEFIGGPTYVIDNPLTLAGNGIWFDQGALHTLGNGITLTNNSPTTLAGDTTIGQYGIGGSMVMNQPIGGTGNLMLHAQAGGAANTKTYEMYASNTYAGITTLHTAFCSSTYNLHGHQRFPYADLTSQAYAGALTLDLNGFNQTVGRADVNGSGNTVLRSTGGAGTFTADSTWYAVVLSGGSKLIVDGGTVNTPGYILVRDNCELLVTGGIVNCGSELLNGYIGSTGTITVANHGEINSYVVRAGCNEFPGWGDEPSVVNLNSGGILRTAAVYAFGNDTDNVVATYLSFDGGVLSDGYYAQWMDSYSNWVMRLTNLVVKAGGARIEVNSALRGINKTLLHDPALGSTPDGGLTKLGGGLLSLGAPNNYTGPTIVNNGTLAFAAPGALPAASMLLQLAGGSCDVSGLADSTLTLGAGRTLAGNGIVVGSLNVGAGAVVRPGASLGILNVTSNVAFGAGALYQWEIGADGNADLLVADGQLTLPGSVNAVTVQVGIAGASVVESNTFILCSAVRGIAGAADAFYMDYGTTGIGGPEHPSMVGNDVLVELYVPEPAVLGVLLIMLAALRRT